MSDAILVADDDTSVLVALRMLLTSQGYEVVAVTTQQAVLEQAKSRDFAAVLIDLNYQKDTTSGKEGLALIQALRDIDDSLPIVVMTGYSSVEIAVEAMKLGAADFVQKPWVNERLLHSISTQIQLNKACHQGQKLARENALLKDQIESTRQSIVAESKAMKAVLSQIQKLAQSDMSVLLTGENGTGKSLLAEFIHNHSPRKEQAFVAVNVGAISETLFESDMFGHVKGAFTDAVDNRIGRFELAESGTIFLDEIANISTSQQAKLLRVLEEKQFEKVGCSKTQRVDVRLVSATNADLDTMVQDKAFRQDLLFRLNTVSVHIPALRERVEDIIPLAQNFVRQYAKKYKFNEGTISPQAIDALLTYSWPGNIRELSHVLERALFLRSQDVIQPGDLSLNYTCSVQTSSPEKQRDWQEQTLDDIEKQVIEQRQLSMDNNPLAIAKSLGLSRSAYYRRLEKYKLS